MKLRMLIATSIATVLTLTGCSTSSSSSSEEPSKSADTAIVVTNAYARATDDMSYDKVAKTYMTGIFLVITNNSDEDVNVSTGTSENAPMVEIHEVVDGKMQKKQGGLTIKAHSSEELKPGGNHVMLMGMTEGLPAGTEISVDLEFDNGSIVHVVAPVKVVNLEQEHYHSATPAPSISGM